MPVDTDTISRMLPVMKCIKAPRKIKTGLSRHYLWPLLVVFSACASLATDPNSEPQPENSAAVVDQEVASVPVAEPEQGEGLTADLLYDLLLSNLALQQGELGLATESLIRAARATGDPVLIAQATRTAVHSRDYVAAVELGQRWIQIAPGEYQASIITALAAVMSQQPDIATRVLSSMMANSEESIGLRFGQLGEVFLQFAEGQAAQEALLNLAEAYPEFAEAWLVLASMAQKNEDFPGMSRALDSLLALEPGSESAAGYKLAALTADPAAQLTFANDFLQAYPDAGNFRMQYARLLLRLENEEQALEQLLVLLQHDPKNSEALNLIALLYQAREDYENASHYFAKKIKFVPGDDRSRLYLAHSLQELERYDEAKNILAEVTAADQVYAAERQMSLLIEQADGAEAALVYMQTLSGGSEPQATQLLIDRELMLRRAGRSGEADTLINDELAQRPDNDTLRYHRALGLVEREDLKGHEEDMRILLAHKPENAHYNNTLGYSILVMSDRLDDAALLINKAHELEADDPYILDSKGWLEYKMGNLESALEYLTRAYALDQDAEIAAHIGEVYWVLNDHETAREFWREGDKIDPDNASLREIKDRFLK